MINFTKMHGLGNDFVVIDAINQPIDLTAEKSGHYPIATLASVSTSYYWSIRLQATMPTLPTVFLMPMVEKLGNVVMVPVVLLVLCTIKTI